ncbi:hypothetical protein [Pseudomonas sp. NY11382]|uniref:hypothetical protein n=2 Tax=unclassified Pseudomonas TaxID=196821 RepID=UPI0022DD4C94|nr:hypothetical protein [Pseudomonas sp. NY11382]WBM32210.1 hypothetical protein M2J80_22185 [Pseudomonas sp. NY11382]
MEQGHRDVGPAISAQERARVARAARQLVGYANFLRWTANFKRDEVLRHPEHDRVMLLSPMQSGRFSFALEGETLYLGVQPFEAAWVSNMPFEAAYVSDRLYLSVNGVNFMDSRMPALALGIFVDDAGKRARMAAARFVQCVQVAVRDGYVVEVGELCGEPVEMRQGDVVRQLRETRQAKVQQQDMGRFF